MTDVIVVPLDGSGFAEQALAPAITLARVTGARLLLVRSATLNYMVLPEPIGYGYVLSQTAADERVREATDYLNSIQQAYAADDLVITTHVADADPAAAILDAADGATAGMIVMTTHGYTGMTRWMLGSVAGKVVRHAHCPVLALRSALPPRRLLLPLDGSEVAERALRPALLVANAFGAELVLLRVIEDVLTSAQPRDALSLVRRDEMLSAGVMQNEQSRAERYLSGLLQRLANEGLHVRTLIGEGAPAEVILHTAAENDCDLIAMSTHGRSGITRWLLGSVTERVLATCGRSMLIVR